MTKPNQSVSPRVEEDTETRSAYDAGHDTGADGSRIAMVGGVTVQYAPDGSRGDVWVVEALNGDPHITQADLSRFLANNRELQAALEHPDVEVPIISEDEEKRREALEQLRR